MLCVYGEETSVNNQSRDGTGQHGAQPRSSSMGHAGQLVSGDIGQNRRAIDGGDVTGGCTVCMLNVPHIAHYDWGAE